MSGSIESVENGGNPPFEGAETSTRHVRQQARRPARPTYSGNAGGFVVGLPLNMDGTEGSRVKSTRDLVAEMLIRMPLPTAYQDERMSSQAVERAMIREADLSRAKRKKSIDSAAAAYILQAALDTF